MTAGWKLLDGCRVPEAMTEDHVYVAVRDPECSTGVSTEWIWGRKTEDPSVVTVDTQMVWPRYRLDERVRVARRAPDETSATPYWVALGEAS